MPGSPYLLTFDSTGSNAEGFLTSTQRGENLPFVVKRVFWTNGTPAGAIRGQHANKATEEVLIALSGNIRVRAETGGMVEEFELKQAQQGLYIPVMCWTELTFSEGAIALCLASTDFNEADYIYDYAYFRKLSAHQAL
ncbi:FdtA/QdtA family cupin domain-containing protein [Pontibacter sp. 172403-2]|uniref:sugar 3,4-ketoisomerase n=1 Tax=Pontibacter rufus TaxID=2791028 RepID=UPI0018AFD4D4|nr:FdtA/QdtA family cupin domain-containing protein [Pontibacter sp. 172403-2]MBF9252334.1 FdtA/QdtA family cupin domain-containing protein [Pontibacter sp. 172403-2]